MDTLGRYRSLVKRGVLIDSFKLNNPRFIPTVPELYLYLWAKNKALHAEISRLLWQILTTRYEFTPVKFEMIHSSWEQLMRYVRQGNPKYLRIPLNELYRLNGAAPAVSCLVDGQSILEEIEYIRGRNIILQPNTIYKPRSNKNAGWDRLIVLEAFPVLSVLARDISFPCSFRTNLAKKIDLPCCRLLRSTVQTISA